MNALDNSGRLRWMRLKKTPSALIYNKKMINYGINL
jgi:hypothetical protein